MHMNSQQAGAQAGYIFATVLFLLSLWFIFVKGLPEQKRSLKLANLALGCGLLLFAGPERFPWPDAVRDGALLGSRLLLILVAVGGIVLAVMALRARAADGATGNAKSIIAMLLCGLMIFTSGGMMVMSHAMRPENDTSWEWRSAQYGYRLRVPSSGCVESKAKGADAAFVCRLRRMNAAVFAKPGNQAAYSATIEEMRAQALQTPVQDGRPVDEVTHTEAGWPCYRTTLVESAREGHGPTLVSVAVVHWPEKDMVFTVLLEGEKWTVSEGATELVRETFKRDAHALQVSLGPASM
jgi:hypothetical protein